MDTQTLPTAHQDLVDAHASLKAIDTAAVGQPHKDVFHEVLNTLLKIIPIIAALFHHATLQPPVILPGTSLTNEKGQTQAGE